MRNSMIAHLWANEKKESAHGSNFYFEGASIYSYGSHFEAGRIIRNKRGEKAYLINDEYYSNTTSKHQAYVRGAIPHGEKVFNVGYDMSDKGKMSFVVKKLEIIKEHAESYKRAKTEKHYSCIWLHVNELMGYIEFFNMPTPKQLMRKSANEWLGTKHELACKSDKEKQEYVRELKRVFKILLDHQALEVLGTVNVIVDEICGGGTWIGYTERCQKYRIAQEEREAKRIEAARIENEVRKKQLEERIKLWKAGEIQEINVPYEYHDLDGANVWLRIKNGKVETSKGIKLYQSEAERLWKIIMYFHDGNTFQHNIAKDVHGNSWKFNSYQNDLLVAGCHRIAYSEMEAIAKQLGLE